MPRRAQLHAAGAGRRPRVAVDDFAPEELSPRASARETCYRKRCRDRRPRSRRPSGLHRRRQPHAVHQGARAGRARSRRSISPSHCGRPLLLRQPFAPDAFDQVILGCVNVIADEMNPARVAALRLGMGDAMTGVHGADQLRLRHAVDRHRAISTSARATPTSILAGGAEALSHAPLVFRTQRGRVVRAAVRRARHLVAARGACGIPSVVPQAGRSGSSAA